MSQEMTDDPSLMLAFGTRRGLKAAESEAARNPAEALIHEVELAEFVSQSHAALLAQEQREVLRRAIFYTLPGNGESVESRFISLYAALESTLTFFRRADEYEILPRAEFAQLERDLKRWLKAHPLLSGAESVRRALIYEKLRELNRFPFAHVYRKFCDAYRVELSDLWPVPGRPEEWPLAEIRHRLVHGDPFQSSPAEALACALEHLRWTVERMLLAVLGWPLERSAVSPSGLYAAGETYLDWRRRRALLA